MADTTIPLYDGDDRTDRAILYHQNDGGSFSPTAYVVNHEQSGYFNSVLKRATLANGTGVAYSAGDVVGAAMELTNVVANAGDLTQLLWAMEVDRAKVTAGLFLFFFDEQPTGIPADNATFDLTVGDQAKLVGLALEANNTTVTMPGGNLIRCRQGQPYGLVMKTKSTSLWVVAITNIGGTAPATASAVDLLISFARK